MTETPDAKPSPVATPPSPQPGPVLQAASAGLSRFARKRTAFVAIVAAVAGAAGAFGAAVAVAVLLPPREGSDRNVARDIAAQKEMVAKIDSDLGALRGLAESSAKGAEQQAAKQTERLDRIEKALAEPAARLAKLSDAVDKLRTPAVAAASPAATPPAATPQSASRVATAASAVPRDVTGAVTPTATPASPQVIPGWTVRDVIDGGAVLRGPRGLIDVFVGDTIPGIGRVDAIRRQDGRWVVVTAKGNIVGR